MQRSGVDLLADVSQVCIPLLCALCSTVLHRPLYMNVPPDPGQNAIITDDDLLVLSRLHGSKQISSQYNTAILLIRIGEMCYLSITIELLIN